MALAPKILKSARVGVGGPRARDFECVGEEIFRRVFKGFFSGAIPCFKYIWVKVPEGWCLETMRGIGSRIFGLDPEQNEQKIVMFLTKCDF